MAGVSLVSPTSIEEFKDRYLRPTVDQLIIGTAITIVFAAAGLIVKFGFGIIDQHPRPIVVGMALFWVASFILLVVRGKRERELRVHQIADLAHASYAWSSLVIEWATDDNREATRNSTTRSVIETMLKRMCASVVPQVDLAYKGATFLLLDGPRPDASFELIAHFNHDYPGLPAEIKELTRDNSTAGTAIRTGKIVAMKDCLSPPKEISYFNHHTPPRFRARVAIPVRAWTEGQNTTIGAVGFDVRWPKTVSTDDQLILTTFAGTIGTLYAQMMLQQKGSAAGLARERTPR